MSYKYEYGFIGCGNMGKAILSGMIRSGITTPEMVAVSVKTDASKARIQKKYGVFVSDSTASIIRNCKIVFLAIKPQVFDSIVFDLRGLFSENQLIISIMAGKSLEVLSNALGAGETLQIVRAMPNTPAAVMEAMTAVSFNKAVTSLNRDLALDVFGSIGRAEEISENQMDAVTGVSGSSPAYIYMLIEAMADEGVLQGLPRDKAYKFAAQAVLGSAKMVLESGQHPGELKDAVTSPGGTTIEGLAALEADGFRGTVMDGIHAAIEKSKSMK